MNQVQANLEDIYVLSPMQEGMLLHTLMEPEGSLYFLQTQLELSNLDVDAFKQAWQRLTERHTIFRTSFHWEELERPVQVVHREASVPLVILDWVNFSKMEQVRQYRKFLQKDRQHRLLLTEAPIHRLTLIRTAADRYHFIWSHHHILMDGWSRPILFRELFGLYEAFRRGRDLPLPPPQPFRHYIDWLQQQDLQKAEGFWRQTLEGFLAPTPVPGDRISVGTHTQRFEQCHAELSESITTTLQGLVRDHKITLNTAIQGAWALLLGRYSGLNDVLFGSVVSGRPPLLKGSERMVGMFINTLAVRIRLPEEEALTSWLRNLQAQQFERTQYEYSPLAQVQKWSQVPDGTPLFETVVLFENFPREASAPQPRGGKPKRSRKGLSEERTNVPLLLSVTPETDTLQLQLVYDSRSFDPTGMTRLLDHFQTILEQIAFTPKRRVGEVSLLSVHERQRVLVEWNDTAAAYPHDRCLHRLFETQAARTPDAIALTCAGQSLTYCELNRRANQVANHLGVLGIGPESVVGVCLERSLDMVVGLLGILKAGGAYVPLDPAYPPERLSYIISASQARILLIQEKFAKLLESSDVPAVRLDADAAVLLAARDTNPAIGVTPDNLAYIIFTSGSTGKPKGVEGTHRGTVNRCAWMWHTYPFEEGEVTCQKTALSFVDAVWEIFGPLLHGVRNIILPDMVVKDSRELVRTLAAECVTRIVLVPSLLRSILETDLSIGTSLPHLRIWVSSGEALPRDLAERFRQEAPSAILLNLYGSSEVAADVTCYDAQWETHVASVPIGRPIANTRIYILDRCFRLVPIGVEGELYVAGKGLARGYHDRPDLTAERFLPNPFSPEPGERMYKTGDRARWLPDGNIEYLGRVDHQVKIRGFRIELDEVEGLLATHPVVRQGVVVVREVVPGDLRLNAYVALREGAMLTSVELQAFLRRHLPEYMVPSTIVILPELPRTISGKLDRQALLAFDGERPPLEEKYVVPRTPTEEAIAHIWAELLGVERVGAHDNFFHLGGHSLLATRAASRLRNVFGVEVPLRSFFDTPTVAGLAAVVEEGRAKPATGVAPLLIAMAQGEEVPLSFAQQRFWFLDQFEPGSPAYTISHPMRLRGPVDISALEAAVTEVVRRHESLRTTFGSRSGHPFQIINPAAPLRLPVVDLGGVPSEERERRLFHHLREQTRQPWNLARGPLIRMRLLRLAPEEHILHLTLHHILADGWSKALFSREVTVLHQAFHEGRSSPLPELPLQYADFAVWQREWLQGEIFEAQLAYWKKKLDGGQPLELPIDRPRPAMQRPTGARQGFELGGEATRQLRDLAQQEGVSLFMLLLAGFQLFLSRYSGQDDISVGTPIANRNRVELEKVIGLFINTLVMRTDLHGAHTFRQLLARVRETCLDAYDHQDIPFEKLVEKLQPQRDPSRQPLFQALFVMGDQVLQGSKTACGTSNLTVDALGGDMEVTNFDLTLLLAETGYGLQGALQYNTDLFEKPSAERMVIHFRTLMEQVAAHPDISLTRIGMLTENEQHQILVDWNRTAAGFPADRCIHELFEEQVLQSSEHPAVIYQHRKITYSELDQRANQLAHRLRRLGVWPERGVGVCLPRSPEALIALLGVLKAGGVYLPLDPTAPVERQNMILRDARPRVLIIDQSTNNYAVDKSIIALSLEHEGKILDQESKEKPGYHVDPSNLAYMIYTSGSTGVPKGVLVEHRSLVNLITAQIPLFGVGPNSRVLQMISLTFDASLGEIFRALVSGATLYQPGPDEVLPGPDLLRVLQEQRISVVTLPPSLLAVMPEGTNLPNLRTLTVGGEACPAELATRWGKGRRLINGYGPTETTVGATLAVNWDPGQKPPLGRPLANVRTYVLDRIMRLAPVGVPGELYIGGVGVARGYLNNPRLTAERFIPDPFSTESGARMYRTGDQVRWLRTGELDFLGRTDQQVKIRGFRIELGEIEAALAQHPEVQACAVDVRDDAGRKQLVGYIVPRSEVESSTSKLRTFLKERLPDYMVPIAFIVLPVLPVTANGKIDRRALPAPDFKRRAAEAYQAPQTNVETILAGIWGDVLRLDRVGTHDNFFELGGDSILSIQVIARAAEAGVRLTPKDLFQHQTIAELASVAGKAAAVVAEQGIVSGAVPLTPIQYWFFEQGLPEPHHFNHSMLLPAMPDINLVLLEQVLQHILIHHDALRLRFQPTEAGWQQFIALPGNPVKVIHVDLTNTVEEEIPTQIEEKMAELQASLNLTEGPLIRLTWFDQGPRRAGRLLVIVHHLAIDTVSWRILLDDFMAIYRSLQMGQTPRLPAKTTSFKQWAEALTDYANSESLKQEQAFWLNPRRYAAGRLPIDYLDGTNTKESIEIVKLVLTEGETRALLHLVPKVYKTQINDILMTALAQALAYWTSNRLVQVDLEGHGREEIGVDIDLSRTVGWFTSFYPLLLDLRSATTLEETLRLVKEQIREVPHRGIGYLVLRYLTSDPVIRVQLQAMPKVEVAFNYMGQMPSTSQKQGRPGVSPLITESIHEQKDSTQSRKGFRQHLIEINGSVRGNCLQMRWGFSRNLHNRSTVEEVANHFFEALREIIASTTRSASLTSLNVSDFTTTNLSQI